MTIDTTDTALDVAEEIASMLACVEFEFTTTLVPDQTFTVDHSASRDNARFTVRRQDGDEFEVLVRKAEK